MTTSTTALAACTKLNDEHFKKLRNVNKSWWGVELFLKLIILRVRAIRFIITLKDLLSFFERISQICFVWITSIKFVVVFTRRKRQFLRSRWAMTKVLPIKKNNNNNKKEFLSTYTIGTCYLTDECTAKVKDFCIDIILIPKFYF